MYKYRRFPRLILFVWQIDGGFVDLLDQSEKQSRILRHVKVGPGYTL